MVMDKVAVMPPERRGDLFRETAARRRLPWQLVEKDFWVSWALGRLFSLSGLPASLLFKGGTSLSKVFDAIDRFSEDVDLSLNREDLGFAAEKDPYAAPSRKQARRLIDELARTCQRAIREELLPALERDFASVLGPARNAWSLRISETDPQTVFFAYPRAEGVAAAPLPAYVTPAVYLEMGARSDHWPVVEAPIQPYAAQEFPKLFSRPHAVVRALSAERTFWEKVTLLHTEHHRPAEKSIAERLSRHYYDVFRLCQGPIGERALADTGLLASVVRHKTLFFHSGWANYDSAVPGSIRILPPDYRIAELRRDYASMAEMIFGEPPEFDTVFSDLESLERRLNA